MKNKKSQGLTLNIIIIAALSLIVLVVLVFIFRGETNKFVKSTDCPAREGVCLSTRSSVPEGEEIYSCPKEKPIKIYTNDCDEVKKKESATDNTLSDYDVKGRPGQCCIPIT